MTAAEFSVLRRGLGRRKKADVSLVSALLLGVFVVGMALAIQGRVQSARERGSAARGEQDPGDLGL